jgi:photosystem II stability/assembly factor-like uncharacterized protein
VAATEEAPVLGASAVVGVTVLVIAGLAAVLSSSVPVHAGGPRGAPAAAGSTAPGAGARGIAVRGTDAGVLRAVAGDEGTGVAAGVGVLWWSTPTHLVWHPAAGVDSALIYTAVVKAGGRYLAMAEDGSAWISADTEGKSFLRRGTAASRPVRAIARVGGAALVAVGDSGMIARCADLNGVTWTALVSPVTAHLRGIAFNGVSAVAVGDGGTILRAGSPGAEWQVVAIDETRDLLAVTADPPPGLVGRYLAVGREGTMWRGEGDGLTWTRLDGVTTGALHGAARVGPTALVVGDAGAIYWSPGSFESWAPMVSTVTTNLRAVTHAGNDLLAVGDDGTILWSLDGHGWRRAEAPVMVPAQEVSWGRVKQLFRR